MSTSAGLAWGLALILAIGALLLGIHSNLLRDTSAAAPRGTWVMPGWLGKWRRRSPWVAHRNLLCDRARPTFSRRAVMERKRSAVSTCRPVSWRRKIGSV